MKVFRTAIRALLLGAAGTILGNTIFLLLRFNGQLVWLSEFGHCSWRMFFLFGDRFKRSILLFLSGQDNHTAQSNAGGGVRGLPSFNGAGGIHRIAGTQRHEQSGQLMRDPRGRFRAAIAGRSTTSFRSLLVPANQRPAPQTPRPMTAPTYTPTTESTRSLHAH